jgi:hypothetical protein
MMIRRCPPSRSGPREPHNHYKLLDVAAEIGLKSGRLYWRKHRRHHLSTAHQTLTRKPEKWSPPAEGELRSTPPTFPEGHRLGEDQRRQQEAAGTLIGSRSRLVAYWFVVWHWCKTSSPLCTTNSSLLVSEVNICMSASNIYVVKKDRTS